MIQEALSVIGRSRDFEDIMKILDQNMITTPDDLMVSSGGERVIRATGIYRGRNNGLTPFCSKIVHINSTVTTQRRIDTP